MHPKTVFKLHRVSGICDVTLVLLSPLTYCSVYALCMPLRSLPSSSSLSPHRMAAAMAHRRLDVGLHPDRGQERTARGVELHTHRRRSQASGDFCREVREHGDPHEAISSTRPEDLEPVTKSRL